MLRKTRFLLAVIATAIVGGLVLGGCGYTPAPILPDYIKSIAVHTFENSTIQYGIEEKLSISTTDEFLRDGRLDIGKREDAEGLLTGTITQYVLEPVSYDEQDIIEEYKLWITVDLVFTDLVSNTVLWDEAGMEGSVNYFVTSRAGELVETEDEAQDRLVEELAEDIVRRTIDGW
ncbi:MAG: LPS assembly lipoprotein LptE [bacterium]